MDYHRFDEMSRERILRHYLWNHDRKEWLRDTLRRFIPFFRVLVLLFALLSPFTTTGILADGANSRALIAQNIKFLGLTLPAMEKAFEEIDSLRKSISGVAYQDSDRAFIYAFLITKWCLLHKLDPDEVAGIIMTESEFNPHAVSAKDARGLMQIHKPTWKMNDYFDIEENIRKGAEILAMYRWQFPGQYLARYSGGTPGYASEVKKNAGKIRDTRRQAG
ncbi:MAG TPA: lytic transglycosylase domain-containing protein [Thermodesulfobacteriota bacterium]|nr:lytic transglycosylase domain-containing protein [Thermodesulfobacteriota bacterium]